MRLTSLFEQIVVNYNSNFTILTEWLQTIIQQYNTLSNSQLYVYIILKIRILKVKILMLKKNRVSPRDYKVSSKEIPNNRQEDILLQDITNQA